MAGNFIEKWKGIIFAVFLSVICTGIVFGGNHTVFAAALSENHDGSAEQQFYIDDQNVSYFLYEDGTCNVKKSRYCRQRNITIPSSITVSGEEYVVKKIEEDAFYKNEFIEKVILSEGIEEIGAYAFYSCPSLQSIELPSSLLIIEGYAFYDCYNLTDMELPERLVYFGGIIACSKIKSVYIPASVTKINAGAFRRCDSLEQLQVDEENQYYTADDQGCLYDKSKTWLLETIPIKETIKIPITVKEIAREAFSYNQKLTSIVIPGNVKRINDYAFRSCNNLMEVTLEEGVEQIGESDYGDRIFANCEKLKKIKLPATLKVLGRATFAGCKSLEEVIIAEDSPYFCTDEMGNIYSKNMDTLEAALYSVTDFVVPDTVKIISEGAFQKTLLSHITLPEGLEEIRSGALSNTRLSSVELPSTLTFIDSLVFQACSLKELKVPLGVTYVAESAFYRMGSDPTVYAYAGTMAEEEAARQGFSFVSLGERLFTDEQGLHYAWENDAWSIIGNEKTALGEIIIPESIVANGITGAEDGKAYPVNKICDWSFYNENPLQADTMKLPENIIFIGRKAFDGENPFFVRCITRLLVVPGSYTEILAKENGLMYSYVGMEDGWDISKPDIPSPEFPEEPDFSWDDSTEPDQSDNANGSAPVTPAVVKVRQIKINVLSRKLAAGGKVNLSATVIPETAANKAVIWKVNNKKYAVIDKNGNLILKKGGTGRTITVTAVAADGSGREASVKITIQRDAVKSVRLFAPQKTLRTGKSMKLKAVVKTTGKKVNKALKWSSSNIKYAVVDKNGKVRAKKAGKDKTVTITASSTDGSGKKAKIKIKIK